MRNMYCQLWPVQCSWLALYFTMMWLLTGVVCPSSQNVERGQKSGILVVLQLIHAKSIFSAFSASAEFGSYQLITVSLGRSCHLFIWRGPAGKGPSSWLIVRLQKSSRQSGLDGLSGILAVEAAGNYNKSLKGVGVTHQGSLRWTRLCIMGDAMSHDFM